MRVVELSLQQVDDETAAQIRVCVEEQRGHGYARMSAIDVTSKTAESQRRILLADHERIVIEPIITHEIVYDRDQMAAVPKPVDAKVPDAEKAPGVTGPNLTKAPTVAPVNPKPPMHQAVNSPKPTSPMGAATMAGKNSEQKSEVNPQGKSVDGMQSSADIKASDK